MEENVILEVQKPEEVKQAMAPKAGCRKVKLIQAVVLYSRYGGKEVHLDFDYKGYLFGMQVPADSPALYKIFGGNITKEDIGKEFFVEVEIKYGKYTGRSYPFITGKDEA